MQTAYANDTGSEPLPDGTFLLTPSGSILTLEEFRAWRAQKTQRPLRNDCVGLSWDEIERRQGGKLKRDAI